MPHTHNELSHRIKNAMTRLKGRSSTREIAEEANLEISEVAKILRNLEDDVIPKGGRSDSNLMWELRSK